MNLVQGLEAIIAHMEQLEDNTVFNMNNYERCVMGQFLIAIDSPLAQDWVHGNGDRAVCIDIFGFTPTFGNFSANAWPEYNQEQWRVIRLFTTAVTCKTERMLETYEISKEDWLKAAKQTLGEMEK